MQPQAAKLNDFGQVVSAPAFAGVTVFHVAMLISSSVPAHFSPNAFATFSHPTYLKFCGPSGSRL